MSFSFFFGGVEGVRRDLLKALLSVYSRRIQNGAQHRSWATPRDVSWSVPPGDRPAAKHLAGGWDYISNRASQPCVLVGSQKSCGLWWKPQHIPRQHRQEAADGCRCRDVWPPDLEDGGGGKSFESEKWSEGSEVMGEDGPTANVVFGSGRKRV